MVMSLMQMAGIILVKAHYAVFEFWKKAPSVCVCLYILLPCGPCPGKVAKVVEREEKKRRS